MIPRVSSNLLAERLGARGNLVITSTYAPSSVNLRIPGFKRIHDGRQQTGFF